MWARTVSSRPEALARWAAGSRREDNKLHSLSAGGPYTLTGEGSAEWLGRSMSFALRGWRERQSAGYLSPSQVIAHYDSIHWPQYPSCVDEDLAHRMCKWARTAGRQDNATADDLRDWASCLRAAIQIVEYALTRAKSIMGPRDESLIRSIEASVRTLSSSFSELHSAASGYIAHPDDKSTQTLSDAVLRMTGVVGMNPSYDQGAPTSTAYYTVQSNGCVLGATMPFVPEMGGLNRRVRMASECADVILSGQASPAAAQKALDDIRLLSDGTASIIRRTLWHLARSRKAPGLWR